MREQTGFEPTVRTVGASDVGLPLHVIDGSLRVRPPEISGYSMVRRSRRPPAVRLVPGEWLRWQINHRFVGLSGGEWHYRLDTFNVYFGPEPSVDVFLGDPKRLVDERTSLW